MLWVTFLQNKCISASVQSRAAQAPSGQYGEVGVQGPRGGLDPVRESTCDQHGMEGTFHWRHVRNNVP